MKELLIFLHLGKTAGTSFVEAASAQFGEHEYLSLYGIGRTSDLITAEIEALTPERRDAVRFIAGHQVWFGIHELFPNRRPRYVTFLRDPVARVFSIYYKAFITPTNQFHERMLREQTTLEAFVNGEVTGLVFNHMSVMLGRDRVRAQHNVDQCERWNDALLQRAIANLRTFWFVGLTESYATDLARLRDLTRLTIPERRSNRSLQPPERAEAPPAIIEACAGNNRMDQLLYHVAALMRESQSPAPLADDF
jgi:hypothetical protein